MKIYCTRCEKVFDDKDIIIDAREFALHSFVPFCKKCHKEHLEEYGYEN